MRQALLARFTQHERLRRRLLSMRQPTTVNGVPEGLIQEIQNELSGL